MVHSHRPLDVPWRLGRLPGRSQLSDATEQRADILGGRSTRSHTAQGRDCATYLLTPRRDTTSASERPDRSVEPQGTLGSSLRTALWDGGGAPISHAYIPVPWPGCSTVPQGRWGMYCSVQGEEKPGEQLRSPLPLSFLAPASAPSPRPSSFLLIQKNKTTQQVVFLVFLFYTNPQFLNLKAKPLLLWFFDFALLWSRLARENPSHPVAFEFQVNDNFLVYVPKSAEDIIMLKILCH